MSIKIYHVTYEALPKIHGTMSQGSAVHGWGAPHR